MCETSEFTTVVHFEASVYDCSFEHYSTSTNLVAMSRIDTQKLFKTACRL